MSITEFRGKLTSSLPFVSWLLSILTGGVTSELYYDSVGQRALARRALGDVYLTPASEL